VSRKNSWSSVSTISMASSSTFGGVLGPACHAGQFLV
jgi:hypothetical protein